VGGLMMRRVGRERGGPPAFGSNQWVRGLFLVRDVGDTCDTREMSA